MEKHLAKDLIEFIYQSPTNFHVVSNVKQELMAHGFEELSAGEAWKWFFPVCFCCWYGWLCRRNKICLCPQ